MVEEVVKHTELMCDLIEKEIPDYAIFGKRLSKPASAAAARAFFYVEEKLGGVLLSEKKFVYEMIFHILHTQKAVWDALVESERIALLSKIGASAVLVFH